MADLHPGRTRDSHQETPGSTPPRPTPHRDESILGTTRGNSRRNPRDQRCHRQHHGLGRIWCVGPRGPLLLAGYHARGARRFPQSRQGPEGAPVLALVSGQGPLVPTRGSELGGCRMPASLLSRDLLRAGRSGGARGLPDTRPRLSPDETRGTLPVRVPRSAIRLRRGSNGSKPALRLRSIPSVPARSRVRRTHGDHASRELGRPQRAGGPHDRGWEPEPAVAPNSR